MKKILILSLLFALGACHPRQVSSNQGESDAPAPEAAPLKQPKNIVLMIGDGMGLTQITAGMYSNGNKLNLEQFQFIGLQKTYEDNDLVPDSAAGVGAIACGGKNHKAAIGLDKAGKPVPSILEEAEARGMATGLVVTGSITHATPASFYAHQKGRGTAEAIALDILNSSVDFFVGGGKQYFDQRKDGQNLIAALEGKGYAIATMIGKGFGDIPVASNKKFGCFTANAEPLPVSKGRDYLAPASQSAVHYLSQKSEKGFFLVVEGAQIDWAGHANDSDYIIQEMIDFDNAIGGVLDFVKQDGETLLIVTADHETGGYTINPGSKIDSIVPDFTTDKPTAVLVPVFAYGPGAELFTGIMENTAIYAKMKKALGLAKT